MDLGEFVVRRASLQGQTLTGGRLKALRKRLGLSLAEASRQVEVSTRTWARWESGVQKIPGGAIKLFLLLNKVKP